MRPAWLLCALVACGRRGTAVIDSGPIPPDCPSQITIVGQLASHDDEPLPSTVTVAANRLDDDSLVASTSTTNDQFALTLPAGFGDVYLLTTGSGYDATYYDFPGILYSSSYSVAIDLFTPAAAAALYTAADVTAAAGTGTIEVRLSPESFDGDTGIVVSNSPTSGVVVYDGANGQPSQTGSATSFDGHAYILNAATGKLVFQGAATPFNPTREVRVFAGAITQYDAPPVYGGD